MSSYICNELMVDIFEKLPPKSIIRFRSLSKYWQSYLFTPEFLRNHRLQCSKKPQKVLIRHILYCGNYADTEIYTLHSEDQLPSSGYASIPGVMFSDSISSTKFPNQHSVVGSCNGILCLHNTKISLWNLSIRRRLIVPRRPQFSSKLALGFGFDPTTDDYKIVSISYPEYEFMQNYNHNNNDTFIFSLRTNSWSVTPSPSTRFYDLKSPRACFLNGILHWVVAGYLTANQTNRIRTCFILTFDLSSHVFGHIVLPEPKTVKQVTTINGCLAVVSWEDDGIGEVGDNWEGGYSWIWMMKEYGNIESWCVCFKPETRGSFDVIRVLQPITNGDILAYYKGSKVYNLRTREFTELMKFGLCCYDVEMEPYAESLELVDKESAIACGKTISSWTKNAYQKSFCGCLISRKPSRFGL